MSKGRVTVSIPSEGKNSAKVSDGLKSNNKKKRSAPQESSSSASESDSDNDNDELSSDDEDLMNDEVDLDAVSDSDDGSDDDDDDDDDENLPKLKKRKKNRDDGTESFSKAVNAILGSKLKAYDRKDPIMARSKQTIKKAESDKLEAKARRALLADKKKVYDKDRVRNLLPIDDANARQILEHERKLKKIAQRGVIRLFNVVMATQTRTTAEMSKNKVLNEGQKEKMINEISKEKFFDLVKQAGDS